MFPLLTELRNATGGAGIERETESSAPDMFHLDHGLYISVNIPSRQ